MIRTLLLPLGATLCAVASVGAADRVLLTNTNFDGYAGWIAGSNKFVAGNWQAFVSAPDAYPFADRIKPSGSGFTFHSWDDGASDKLENYLFQEFGAGPAGGATPSVFQAGDVVTFTGSARATRNGTNTSDMIVRAFVKMLGYNELGWAFQVKPNHTVYHPIGSTLEPFSLSVTFPDLAVDDSFQVLQVGFEITNSFDGAAMDSGTIYFENIEAHVPGAVTPTWAGYPILEGDNVDTGAWLGWVLVTHRPWIYLYATQSWAFLPDEYLGENGGWAYLLRP